MAEPVLTMWTIFNRPLDQPEHVVVRGFDIAGGETTPRPEGYLFSAVDDARLWLSQEHPELGVRIAPGPEDHESVVETWM